MVRRLRDLNSSSRNHNTTTITTRPTPSKVSSRRIFFHLLWWLNIFGIVGLFVAGLPLYAVSYAVGLILLRLIIMGINKCKKKVWKPTSDWSPSQDQTPIPTISSSVDHAAPPPRSRRAPTPPAATTNHPLLQSSPNLSSQLSHASGFSSPRNSSQTPDTSSAVYAPSAPVLPGYRGRTDVEAATIIAANQPPPAYPAVVGGDPGLPPRPYTAPATDDGPEKVSELSNDGLPSYEAAMSTRQPPAYEAPHTPRDDGPTTND